MPRIRVGIVGCGVISEAHIRAYQKVSDRAEIVVCCDPDLQRAQSRADLIGPHVRITTDAQEVFGAADVDAVDLLTPHHVHLAQTRAALAAGKHVLLQKPLATSLEECDEIVKLGESARTVLYYGETHHTMPCGVAARQAILDGEIGQVVATQATYAHWQGGVYLTTPWRYDPKIAGGGALLDGGIHHLALMHMVVGPMVSVSAIAKNVRPELGGEDTSVVTVEYANGAFGSLVSTHATGMWSPTPSLIVYGTRGILTVESYWGPLVLHRPDLPEGRQVWLPVDGDGFEAMITRYLDVIAGRPSPSTVEMGRHEFAVVMAAYRSAESGQREPVI